MKAGILIFAILQIFCGATFALATGNHGFELSQGQLEKRQDDEEWTLVSFPTPKTEGQQCGGTSKSQTGSQGICARLASAAECVNISVAKGFVNCNFQFKPNSCSDAATKEVTVNGGTDSNGVDTGTEVQFVQVTCTGK